MHVVADRQILARRQRQDAQSCVFGGGPQEGKEMIHGLKNISISLCVQGGSKAENCCRKTMKRSALAYSLQTAASVCNTHFRTSCLWPGMLGPAGMDPGLALMIASVFKVAT